MTPEEVISKAAQESRANAGISQNTDQAAAFETGYELGWELALKSDPRVLALVEAGDKALFALQCMIIQHNGAVPGLTEQEVFDGAMKARDEYKSELAQWRKGLG